MKINRAFSILLIYQFFKPYKDKQICERCTSSQIRRYSLPSPSSNLCRIQNVKKKESFVVMHHGCKTHETASKSKGPGIHLHPIL